MQRTIILKQILYKIVSNNLLNLVTVFVTQTSSLQISKPRSTYGEKSINDGVGYDKNEKILDVLPVQYALEYEMLDQIYYNAINTTINTPTSNDFGDYNLYTKLLELAGKGIGDDLNIYDLKDLINLDLQNLSLTSILGLELMQFNNLQTINFNNNNLNNINELNNFLANYPNVVISLIKNKFNLSILESASLQSSNFIWGMQLNLYNENFYKFNDLTHQIVYYWQSSYDAYYEMRLNGESLPKSLSLQYYTFTSYGKYELSFIPNSLSGFFADEQNIYITIIGVTLPNLQVQRNAIFPSVIVMGIPVNELNISVTSVNTTVVSQNNLVTWTISPNVKPTVSYSINGYYDVIDTQAPVVTLESETPLEMEYGETLILPDTEIYITDNNENANYNFIESPEPTDVSYWSKEYYLYENGNYILLNTNLSSQDFGEYAIGYYAVDNYGNVSQIVFRHVIITGNIIEQSMFNSSILYDAILNLTGKTKVYENSLSEFSYINFANSNISKLDGLELLTYQEGTIIDLSKNKIDVNGITKMSNLLEKPNIALINLAFNNLVQGILETNPRYLLGIQGLTKDVYLYHMSVPELGLIDKITFYNYNDYQSYYTLTSSINAVEGFNYIENFGSNTFTFNSLGVLNSATKTIKYGNVYELSSSVDYDVFSSVSVYDLYVIEGIEANDVDFEYENATQPFLPEVSFGNQIGSFNITINVKYNYETLKSFSVMLNINDNTSPTITLMGNEFVYLLLGNEYIENGYSAQDNYDTNPEIEVNGEVDTNTTGIYHITYKAKDQTSNYSQNKTRTIYVGNVTPKSNFKVDVFERINELDMFDFVTYSTNDFNFEVTNQPYNELVVGTYTVDLVLTHKQDESFVIELENLIRVVDRESPVIQLNGNEVVYVFVGSHYLDDGARVNDNYDEPNEISTSSFLNTDLVGSYVLTYQSQDANGNVATPVTRNVNVIHKPFNSLSVFLISNANSLYLGNSICFKANITNYDPNQYNYNSTFIWLVDGVEVQNSKDIYFQTTFSTVGTHQIEVKVLNMNIDGGYTVMDGKSFQVQVTEGGFLEKYGIPIITTTSVIIVLAVIYSLFLRKRRKFYF